MYYSNQTLRHKETNKLVALHPKSGGQWNWEISDKTRFIDEGGKVFFDDIKNYTHIADWVGRGLAGYDRKQNKYVDVTLKQYIVPDEEREAKRLEFLSNWTKKVLTDLETKGGCFCPFADGSECHAFRSHFLEHVKAVPLFYINVIDHKGYVTGESRKGITVFNYNNKWWYVDPHLNRINEMVLNNDLVDFKP